MQISIPHKDFGLARNLPPASISEWLQKNILIYEYMGSVSSGYGFSENGESTVFYQFLIKDMTAEDAIAFKIVFPTVVIYPYYG